MAKFLQYLDPSVFLVRRLHDAFTESNVPASQRADIANFLGPLYAKDRATHEHSIRVGILAQHVGTFVHLDGRALLYAGLLHDVGKAQTRLSTLQKTEGWTQEDTKEIMHHVMDGYRLIRDKFDFSAEIILWHHRFQPNGYPTQMPVPLHDYCEGTRVLIPFFGRILSLCDTFDALHRVNDKHGSTPLTGKQIMERMLEYNRDQRILIQDLFSSGIFTTNIYED